MAKEYSTKFYQVFDENGKSIEDIRGISTYKDSLIIYTSNAMFSDNPELFKAISIKSPKTDKKALLIELNKMYKQFNDEKRLNMWLVDSRNEFSLKPLTDDEQRHRKIGATTAILDVIRFVQNS